MAPAPSESIPEGRSSGESRPRPRPGPASLVALAVLVPSPGDAPPPCPTFRASVEADARDHVAYLADDALEGRAVTRPGARCAAHYLAAHFELLGLEPAGEDGGWFQSFPVRVGSRIEGPGLLSVSGDGTPGEGPEKTPPHVFDAETWHPYGFSGDGRVEAPLVYAGAGVARPGAGPPGAGIVEMEGRIAVVEAESPGVRGVFADPHVKARVAQGRGAAGLLVLLPPGGPLPRVEDEIRARVGIPVAAVQAERGDGLRAAARRGETALLETRVEGRVASGWNVVARLPGEAPSREGDAVVVGAHYDHLGWGGPGSRAPGVRAIHNGADDNGSGTAALLEVAEALAREGPPPARTVLFVAFSGEERGLLGSRHFVDHPPHPLENVAAMVNLDMVGRLRGGRVVVHGVGTAAGWAPILEAANGSGDAEPLTLQLRPRGDGPSDHRVFHDRGVPVLHFFTGTHPDYHRPEDDADEVNAYGIERVVGLVARLVREVAGSAERAPPTLTSPAPPPPERPR